MRKLFKVKVGKPTGGDCFMSRSYLGGKIQPQYFVVARTFNEAGKLVMNLISKVVVEDKNTAMVTEYGIEHFDYDFEVCGIELVTDELIIE